ncbi:MAG: hypothetical protein ACM31C_10620 [Acidobacteriota bacterium]
MAKPPDKHDTTMPLSESQVVAVTQKPPDHAIPKNDRSVWLGRVVGADEFAPQPAKRSPRRWLVIGALGIVAGGAGIAGYEAFSSSGSGSASMTAGSAAPQAVPPPAPAPLPADAPAPADAPPADAAPADAPADAAVAVPQTKPPPRRVVKKKPPARKRRAR